MLTKKQILEIREHLDKAQNPLFFFDNDQDGLCSFLLLQRDVEKGKGIPIRSFPELTGDYFRRVEELNADYIFILDKPLVSKEFLEEARKVNIPIVWIDHHAIDKKDIPDFVYYYNPLLNKDKKNEPVTFLCYSICRKKDDLWIAVIGCISDKFFPDFYEEFKEKYPDLAGDSKFAFDVFYKSQIGKIAQIFGFALKDRTTEIINMLRFLMKVKTPYEILEDTSKNHHMHFRFNYISEKYNKLIDKAKVFGENESRFLFFQYAGDLSISSELSNELGYLFPEKVVVVIYLSGVKANISVRGKNIRSRVLNAIKNLDDATGGGHEEAVGLRIRKEDVEKFKENLRREFS